MRNDKIKNNFKKLIDSEDLKRAHLLPGIHGELLFMHEEITILENEISSTLLGQCTPLKKEMQTFKERLAYFQENFADIKFEKKDNKKGIKMNKKE